MRRSGPSISPRLTITDPERDREAVVRAGTALSAGGLVAFPTETVYGLGADAFDATAVGRIFTAKGRPADNPLIVHLAEADQLDRVAASTTPLALNLSRRFWPGPLTIIVEAHRRLPPVTTGGLPTVAVRVPDHAVARAIIAAAGTPIAAPSANRSGRPSPTTADHVAADLGAAVDLLVDGGATGLGVESTVVDARGALPVIYREGALTREQLGPVLHDTAASTASPGTRHRHYAPACAVEIVEPEQLAARASAVTAQGLRAGTVAPSQVRIDGVIEIAGFDDVEELARELYGALRDAEDADLDVLLCTAVPETGVGRAVMDRLRRAAAG